MNPSAKRLAANTSIGEKASCEIVGGEKADFAEILLKSKFDKRPF